MDAAPPPQPDGEDQGRARTRLGTWSMAAGAILGAAAVICVTTGEISAEQDIALALPAALLVIGGLLAALLPDTAAARRFSFQAGLHLGSLLTRLRSITGRGPRELARPRR